ncbi:rhodanese-like domain-containing protein [Flavobacterium sp. JP2137]|uniref:rhodanese-like domain-containing protein n=1 Tax=Flavobacterium sp. JP2137 TaxID=3414510 RepID=UPI003D301145
MKIKFYSFLLMLTVVFACQGQVGDKAHLLEPSAFEKQITAEKGQLIDVRTAAEFDQDHISGAENIDVLQGDFDANIAKLDKDKPVYVYCKSGGRSAKAIDKLKAQGFTNLYELQGGFTAWKAKAGNSKGE